MGIKYSNADANSSSSKQESDIKNTFKQYGLDPTKHGQYFTIDQDEDLVATSTLTDIVGMNAAFNDDFFSKVLNVPYSVPLFVKFYQYLTNKDKTFRG